MKRDLGFARKLSCAAVSIGLLSSMWAPGFALDQKLLENYKKAVAADDDEQIVKWATQVIQSDPKNAQAYVDRAHALCHKKKFEAAVRDATCAIELNPKLAKAYVVRGKAGYLGESSSLQVLKD